MMEIGRKRTDYLGPGFESLPSTTPNIEQYF